MRAILDSEIGKWALRTFRPAAVASWQRNVLKTLVQSLVFWAVFLGLIPLGLARIEEAFVWSRFEFAAQSLAPWVLFACAGSLGIYSGVTMAVIGRGTPLPLAAPRRLVVAGPYRFVRNPMAVAGLIQAACVGAVLGSWLTIAYAIAGGLVWNGFVRPLEEADLESRFGRDFVRYRTQVRCWTPRASPYQNESERSSSA